MTWTRNSKKDKFLNTGNVRNDKFRESKIGIKALTTDLVRQENVHFIWKTGLEVREIEIGE